MAATYTEERWYVCDLCNYRTTSKENIEKHVLIPDKNLPVGFVFSFYDGGYKLWRPAVLVKEGRIDHNHVRDFYTWCYSIANINNKSMVDIIPKAQCGEVKIYSQKQFEEVKPIAEKLVRMFNEKEGTQLDLTLIRTTPELEELLGDKDE